MDPDSGPCLEFPKIRRPDIYLNMIGLLSKDFQNDRALVIRTPTERTPIYGNGHIVLVRISSKPASYQPQSPLKGALNLFEAFPT